MTKRVVISQDYDGCYSIVAPNGVENERNGHNKQIYKQYPDLNSKLEKLPILYNDYLTDLTKEAESVSVYVGSDRQSKALDELNIRRNKNGSAFSALNSLCEERNQKDGKTWTFEPFLLADGNNPRGSAFERMKNSSGHQLEAPEPSRNTDEGRPSKIPLLMAQMRDIRKQYPNDEIEFNFIDDRQDLINDICKYLKPKDIPEGICLKINKFDYVGVLQDEPNALGFVKAISNVPVMVAEKEPPKVVEIPLNFDKIKEIIQDYTEHLQMKIAREGILLPTDKHEPVGIPEGASEYQKKLITRYNSMLDVNNTIKSPLTCESTNKIKEGLIICNTSSPTWSEKPFITKLTDILSLGLKPLLRSYFSSEATYQKSLNSELRQGPSI
jgi:hypothetical protein